MEDFSLEISFTEKQKKTMYYACLTYIGNDYKFRQAIKNIQSKQSDKDQPLCLIIVNMIVNPNWRLDGNYEWYTDDDTPEDEINFSFKSDCHLFELYNHTIQYELQNYEPVKKLKGVAHVILCLIVQDIISRKILDLDNYITVEASGSIEGKGMEGLIKYYQSIGFNLPFPELLDIGLEQKNVPMRATLNDILQNCNGYASSSIMKQLLNIIRYKS
jgi:hypothetical protein